MFWHHADLREILCKICNSQKFVAEPSWHCWPSPSLQNNHSTPLQTIWENLPQILFPLKLKYCLFVMKNVNCPLVFLSFFLISFFINCKKWKKCTLNTIFVRLQMQNCRIKEIAYYHHVPRVKLSVSDEIDSDIFLWKYFTESKYCWLF